MTIEKRIELWRRRISQADPATLVVSQDRERLAGFCLFGPTRDEDGKGRPVGEIIALNVGPEHWRRGHGRTLCEFALHEAPRRGWSMMTLWILKGNERAMRFYDELRYRKVV